MSRCSFEKIVACSLKLMPAACSNIAKSALLNVALQEVKWSAKLAKVSGV